MSKLGVLSVPGKSGTIYKFDAYPLNTVWTALSAVYLVTHRDVLPDGNAEHVYVQLAQTPNLQELDFSALGGLGAHSANCVCILQEEDHQRRVEIVNDIADASLRPP